MKLLLLGKANDQDSKEHYTELAVCDFHTMGEAIVDNWFYFLYLTSGPNCYRYVLTNTFIYEAVFLSKMRM